MSHAREARRRRGLGARRQRGKLVTKLALTLGALAFATSPVASANPFNGRGMWIWEMPRSNGGDVSSIVSRARQYGVKTLFIKSGDGSGHGGEDGYWSQFSSSLVSALHANGIRACGWQFVYGNYPATEAHVGAAAVSNGADCLVIDAEGQYEGKYMQAQRYVTTLRKLVGRHYPVGLAGFPYVDYHPGFPYSIFLGPGGAQYNAPQMYWVDIGTTVDRVYSHTFAFNRIYGRPIFPLGQIYNNPPTNEVVRFRELSLAYSTGGLSWWDWQEATGAGWTAVSTPVGTLANFTPNTGLAYLGLHALGDLVVWAQEHLYTAGQHIKVDGSFGPRTQRAVQAFQTAHGLTASGLIDATTWQVLLRYRPAHVHWTLRRQANTASASGLTMSVPSSASLRGRNEFRKSRSALGRGR
jgi:hypothetical protein